MRESPLREIAIFRFCSEKAQGETVCNTWLLKKIRRYVFLKKDIKSRVKELPLAKFGTSKRKMMMIFILYYNTLKTCDHRGIKNEYQIYKGESVKLFFREQC